MKSKTTKDDFHDFIEIELDGRDIRKLQEVKEISGEISVNHRGFILLIKFNPQEKL